MDSIGVQVGVLLAIIFLLERLATTRGWVGPVVAGIPVLTWLVLSAMAVWWEAVVAFAAVHVLLFALGPDAAGIGLVLTVGLILGTPFAMAEALRRGRRHAASPR